MTQRKNTMRLGAALLVALAASTPSRVRACSCSPARPERRLVLPEGVFPPDGTLRVMTTGFPDEVRERLGAEYRLRDARGRGVPLQARVVATRIDLRPRRLLRPGEYVLESRVAYATDGRRVADAARLQGMEVRLAWFPEARFRVGRAPAPSTATVTLDRAQVIFRHGGGDCGPGTAVHLSYRAEPFRPGDVAELEHRGHGVVATRAAAGDLGAGDLLCDPDPVALGYEPGAEFRVVVRDPRGHVRGASPWHRFDERRSGPEPSHRRRSGLGGWERSTEVPSTDLRASGPASCRYGFEETWRREVAGDLAPWAYGERSTLTTHGAVHWLAFRGTPWTLVRGDDADQRWPLALDGRPGALSAGPAGVVMVVRGRRPTLVAVDGRGRERWRSPLPSGSTRHRLARMGNRLLVAWAQEHDGGPTRHLGWALVDLADGSLSPVHGTEHSIERGSTEAPTAVALGDHFLLAWTPEGAPMSTTLVVDREGRPAEPRALPAPGDGVPDLVAVGNGAVLANAHQGRIQLTFLDSAGGPTGPPREVDAGGRNRLPRVAWGGQHLAVAWEGDRNSGAFVTAVSRDGVASPPLRLDRPDEPWAGTVGVAAVPGGFVASYTFDRRRAALVGLRCRATPGLGGPARIAPLDAGQRRSPAAR